MSNNEIGKCSKCLSDIPHEAERCPECGFEPHVGVLGGAWAWVCLMLGSTSLVIALSTLAVIADGFPIQDGLIAFVFFGLSTLFFFGVVRRKWRVHTSKPTQPRDEGGEDGEQTSFGESIREGRERGEEWKNEIDAAPSWVFDGAVISGSVLSLSAWGFAMLELEATFFVCMVLGLVGLGLSVMIDVKRVNRVQGSSHRWYAYSIPAAIPLVGWMFGLYWLRISR